MIIATTDLKDLRRKYRSKKIVSASGVFDLLHVGHVEYLQSLKSYGDITVVLVKPDARIKRHKHPNRPVIPEADRARMVDAVKGVDYVVIGSDWPGASEKIDKMYENFFDFLEPDVYVTTNKRWGILEQVTRAKLQVLPRNKAGHLDSTTMILERIHSLDSF